MHNIIYFVLLHTAPFSSLSPVCYRGELHRQGHGPPVPRPQRHETLVLYVIIIISLPPVTDHLPPTAYTASPVLLAPQRTKCGALDPPRHPSHSVYPGMASMRRPR